MNFTKVMLKLCLSGHYLILKDYIQFLEHPIIFKNRRKELCKILIKHEIKKRTFSDLEMNEYILSNLCVRAFGKKLRRKQIYKKLFNVKYKRQWTSVKCELPTRKDFSKREKLLEFVKNHDGPINEKI